MIPPATAVSVPLPIPVPIRIIGCRGCGACLLTCPQGALRPVPGGLRVRADRCTGCLECLEICPVDAISATLIEPEIPAFHRASRVDRAGRAAGEPERRSRHGGRRPTVSRQVHPIEIRSYTILRERVDTSALPRLTRAVTERVVHASADLGYVDDLVCEEAALAAGSLALRRGAPVVTDVAMVAAGITRRDLLGDLVCPLTEPQTRRLAEQYGLTRSAAAIRVARDRVGPGAIWVVGCAPTALAELIIAEVAPALVIGLPVGFVGATESKAALRASGLPAVSNRSAKGGSAVAAAALNALLYAADPEAGGSGDRMPDGSGTDGSGTDGPGTDGPGTDGPGLEDVEKTP